MRRRGLLAVAAVLTVVAATLLAVGLSGPDADPPQAPRAAGSPPAPSGSAPADDGSAPSQSQSRSPSPVRGPVLPAADPERISIPSLDVDSTLERLGRGPDGAMDTPRDPDRAGWYTPGPAPGEQGPSVIAGHVTWDGDRSVFFRLGELRRGDRIEVARADGRTARFEVQRVARYPKDEFPTVEVYRNLDHAGLRLITCGGSYDQKSKRYADNVVVFAAAAPSASTAASTDDGGGG